MSFRFNPNSGLIVVPVHMSGPISNGVVRLALDTGATFSVVSWDAMVTLGYDPAVINERIRMTTGSGIEFAPLIHVGKIQALEQERWNFPVLCHTLPPSATVEGVLGLDFFRNTRLVIDFKEGTIGIE